MSPPGAQTGPRVDGVTRIPVTRICCPSARAGMLGQLHGAVSVPVQLQKTRRY